MTYFWPKPEGLVRRALEFSLVALLYYGFFKLGMLIGMTHKQMPPFWPAAGYAIFTVFAGGPRRLPAVSSGMLLSYLITGSSLGSSLLQAFGNSLEALLGAMILRQLISLFRSNLGLAEALGCIATSLFAPLPSAFLGASGRWIQTGMPNESGLRLLGTWWLGDSIGILVMLPSLLALSRDWNVLRRPTPGEQVRILGLCLGIATLSWLTFFRGYGAGYLFAMGPVLMIATAWFGYKGARFTALVVAWASLLLTAQGLSPFSGSPPLVAAFLHQIFLAGLCLTALVLPLIHVKGDLRLPALILLAGWSLSAWLLANLQSDAASHKQRELERFSLGLRNRMAERLGNFETLLRGGAALHSAQGSLRRQLWHDYVQSLDLGIHYRELNALSVILPIGRNNLDTFVSLRRADDCPNFIVRPVLGMDPSQEELLYLTSYIEPNLPNAPALGVDNASDPGRLDALNAARDNDQARLSRHTQLVVDGGRHAGFLLFLPLYQPGFTPFDVPSRRKTFQGWLAASFIAENLFDDALGADRSRFFLQVYEDSDTSPDNLIYSSTLDERRSTEGLFRQSFTLYDRRFTVECAPQASFSLYGDGNLLATSGCLFIITILLAGLILSMQGSGQGARHMAARLNEELQKAKSGLQDSLRFQEAIINATSFCIIATDAQGLIEVFNSGAEKMLGYRRHELVGKLTPLLLHDPEELAARAAELSPVVGHTVAPDIDCVTALPRLGRVDQHEWTFLRKDGSRLPVLLCINARYDAEGGIVGYVGIAYDLSAQRRAEENLRKAHHRLKSIFDTTSEGLMLIDQRGRIVEWNTAAAAMLGVHNPALMRNLELAEAPWTLITEDGATLPKLSNPALVTLRTAQPQLGINLAIHRLGEAPVWVCTNCQPLVDDNEEVRGVVCSLADISQRREHEHRLRASIDEVKNLRAALDEHAIVYSSDAHGQLTSVNDKFCQITGYSRDELIGQDPRILNSGTHPKEFFQKLWMTILQGKVWKGEICNRTKNGSVAWMQTTICPFAGPDGKPTQFIAICQDLSDTKRLDRELADARDAAIEASRLKSEFLAAMSHEIRTPMNGIIGMAGLLMASPLEPHQRNMGRVIRECSETLLTTIDDILDFSRIEAGRLHLEKSDFWLRQAIEDAVARLGQEAHAKQLELTCDFDLGLGLRACGDEHRIRQIVTNLVRHSIRSTPSGEVSVSVRCLDERARSLRLRLLVTDTGPGLAADALASLFTPFRGDAETARPAASGQGLGLAISQRLAELMGGSLHGETPDRGGFRFVLTLELAKSSGGESSPELSYSLPHSELLVVDDNTTNRNILAGQLRRMGLSCLEAPDAQEALTLLRQRAFAGSPVRLALLDWHMPGMNGLDLAAAIRADPTIRDIRLVMLSSSAPYIDPDSIVSIRFDAFLSKPVREGQLHELLRRILAGDKPGQGAEQSGNRHGLHILLAEDNSSSQAVARLLLSRMGHRVDVSEGGEKALGQLAAEPYDLFLTDCDMPGIDGYECTRRIRDGKVPGVPPTLPIIALTAYSMPEDRQRCIEAGMNDQVAKPLSLQALQEAFFRCGLLGSMATTSTQDTAPLPASAGAPAGAKQEETIPWEPLDAKVIADMRALPGNRGQSLLPELVDTFLREEKGLLGELLLLGEQRKGTQLGATAHRVAGSCSYLGAREIRTLALALETHALKGEWAETESKLAQLKARWPGLREAVRHTLDG
jgi:PAS domain S-box-containing protein